MSLTKMVLGGFVVVAAFATIRTATKDPSKEFKMPEPTAEERAAEKAPDWSKSDDDQAERKRLIEAAIMTGFILKTTAEPVPALYTGAAWDQTTVDQKKQFGVLVQQYLCNKRTERVLIYDGRTGKKLGQFSQSWGLSL